MKGVTDKMSAIFIDGLRITFVKILDRECRFTHNRYWRDAAKLRIFL